MAPQQTVFLTALTAPRLLIVPFKYKNKYFLIIWTYFDWQ